MRDVEKASRNVLGFCFSKACSCAYLEAMRDVPLEAFHPAHQAIAQAVIDVPPFDGGFSDLSAISAKISSIGLKVEHGILADVALTDTTELSALQSIEIIVEIYNQYNLSRTLEKMSRNCMDQETSRDLKAWAESAQEALTKDFGVFARADFGDVSESMSAAIDDFEHTDQAIIKTGFRSIDEICGGFCKKSLVLVAGRPSMGKTSLAVCQAMRSAHIGHKGLVFSLEMSKAQLGQKMISIASKMSLKYLERHLDIVTDVARQISYLNLEICDDSDLSVEDICAITRQKKGIDFIAIDYLQLMRSTPGFQSREREVSHISKSLKMLAKSSDISVIALCQLNRESENRQNHRPKLSDLRESGSLEQDADLVGFVYRDHVYNKGSDPTEAEFIIAKNRLGPIGSASLGWDAGCTRFYDGKRF